ncbi:MAG: signal recognition particle-docking protein FtsY [bacterium]
MFSFFKSKIKKVYAEFTNKIAALFSGNTVDQKLLTELSNLLISADTGVKTTQKIIENLTQDIKNKKIESSEDLKKCLEQILLDILDIKITQPFDKLRENAETKTPNNIPSLIQQDIPAVLLIVGVNGSGKTTFVGKLAQLLKNNNKKVLLVAGDTFRAAATHQLAEWGQKTGTSVFIGKESQDPASVIFDAYKKYKEENFDHIIIDTAGRLQTKVNLMKELEKMRQIIYKQSPQEIIHTWLTIDSMLGQNSLRQAEVFHQATQVNGIVLTKLDGTGKGGIVFSIAQTFGLPIVYVTFGEKLEDLKIFNAQEYVHGLLNE